MPGYLETRCAPRVVTVHHRPGPINQRGTVALSGPANLRRLRFALRPAPQSRSVVHNGLKLTTARCARHCRAKARQCPANPDASLERCRRRTRLASPRADGRQWTTDGQPHASLLHNAAFAKVPGHSLASSLGGRAPLRALRVLQTGVMQSVCPGRRAPATKAGPLPRFLFVAGARRVVCVRRSLVRRFAHGF